MNFEIDKKYLVDSLNGKKKKEIKNFLTLIRKNSVIGVGCKKKGKKEKKKKPRAQLMSTFHRVSARCRSLL